MHAHGLGMDGALILSGALTLSTCTKWKHHVVENCSCFTWFYFCEPWNKMTEEDREKDKEPRSPPFSEEQVVFLRNLLEERGPSTTGQGKGKELAKKASKDAEKPGEYIGEG